MALPRPRRLIIAALTLIGVSAIGLVASGLAGAQDVASIEGEVTSTDGAVSGVVIDLFQSQADGSRGTYLRSTTTDDAGSYRFGLADTACHVAVVIAPEGAAFHDGSRWHQRNLCFGDGETTIRFSSSLGQPEAAIAGDVSYQSGDPANGVVVDLFSATADGTRGSYLGSAVSDETGDYRMGLATTDCHIVVAIAPGGTSFIDDSPWDQQPVCFGRGDGTATVSSVLNASVPLPEPGPPAPSPEPDPVTPDPVTPDPGTPGPELPDPIDPGDRDFGRIVRTGSSDGGVIVLPDGEYRASDIDGLNPSGYLVVVAENPGGVRVTKTNDRRVGETDLTIRNSSRIVFVGMSFENIVTRIVDSSDVYFWHTHHTYPIGAHPDPYQTYCGSAVGPDGVELVRTTRVSLYGSDIDGIGHDAIKMDDADQSTFGGIKIMNLDHGGLQQGRGNERCGWDGDDNYHDDSIQIWPGGVDDLTVEDSYVGRNTMTQVDGNGTSNTNLVFRNNWFQQEDRNDDCLAINARVKESAASGAIQTMTLDGNVAFCPNGRWTTYVQGSRNNAMTINGERISSSTGNVNWLIPSRAGAPDMNATPADTWRQANGYDSWSCYLASVAPGFPQDLLPCR